MFVMWFYVVDPAELQKQAVRIRASMGHTCACLKPYDEIHLIEVLKKCLDEVFFMQPHEKKVILHKNIRLYLALFWEKLHKNKLQNWSWKVYFSWYI